MRKNGKRCLIYPENKHKDNWDIFMAIVLVAASCISPVRIAFNESDKDLGWELFGNIVDFSFLCDIIATFCTAFYDEDFKIVEDRKVIAKNYLCGWFTIDVLAIIPFDYLFSTSELNHLVRFARIGRLYKLVKLTRLFRILKFIKD